MNWVSMFYLIHGILQDVHISQSIHKRHENVHTIYELVIKYPWDFFLYFLPQALLLACGIIDLAVYVFENYINLYHGYLYLGKAIKFNFFILLNSK